MRKATGEVGLDELRAIFDEFDQEYFLGFFEDKGVEILIEEFCDKCQKRVDWLAYACAEDMSIGINRLLLSRPIDEIRNDMLHEMVHLFVCWAVPGGTRVWGDRCAAFKDMCKCVGLKP